jgi:hypothetical protein
VYAKEVLRLSSRGYNGQRSGEDMRQTFSGLVILGMLVMAGSIFFGIRAGITFVPCAITGAAMFVGGVILRADANRTKDANDAYEELHQMRKLLTEINKRNP